MRRERNASTYAAAVRAFRAVTEEPVAGAAARVRVLARAQRRGARGARRSLSALAAPLLVALASGAAAWTAAGRWRAEAPRVIVVAETGPSPEGPGRSGEGRPVRTIPAVAADEIPSTIAEGAGEGEGDGEAAAYARAHRAHFLEDAPARALAAWGAYLASYPAGAFAPEAKYNRALCLARLGRFAEASAVLRPFARGRFGGYRREEATRLLEWLASRGG